MVTACTVLGCSERKGKTSSSNLSFHRFPHKDPERLRKWIQAIGRKDWLPTKHTCICSKHFVESNFVVRPGKSGRRLYDHAVPSQFLSFPERSRNTKRKSLKQQGSMEASHSEQSPVTIGIEKLSNMAESSEVKVTWGLYDELGHLLPQHPAEGPDKQFPHDLNEYKCDVCGQELINNARLTKHRATHFQPHSMDWNPVYEQMKKRKLEGEEEEEVKRQKIENQTENASESDKAPFTQQDEGAESDETEALSHTPGSSILSTPTASPTASSITPPSTKSKTATESTTDKPEITREMLIKEAKKRFNAKQIAAELVKRKVLTECICGIMFEDHAMYVLHRGLHHTENPLQCAHCKHVAEDQKTFMVHFFKHK